MQSKQKTILSGAVTLAVITLILAALFRGQWGEILQCLRAVPPGGLLPLFALALCCPLLEAAAERLGLGVQPAPLTFGQALTACYLNIFGNVVTLGAGSVPLQSWYLSLYGVLPGAGIGLSALCYTLQKTTVLLYATVMLCFQGRWLRASNLSLSRYILLGYLVCAVIIAALILLCTWEKVQRLALWIISKLPGTGAWGHRKELWSDNVRALRTQSKVLLADRRRCLRMMLLYAGRLFLLYALSYRSITLLGLDQLTFWQVQLLSSVMLLVTNALPNVGGAGPTEFAFALLYTPYLGAANAASAMVLYRMASYLFLFLASIPFFLSFRHLVRRHREP